MTLEYATSVNLKRTFLSSVISSAFTEGFKQKDLTDIDGVVNVFMKKYAVPGMSIAFSKDGRLVYAKGFGVARKLTPFDRLLGRPMENVSIWSLFRIASVSKPITAVAIMTLVEQGKLKLSDRVFGNSGLLGTDFGFGSLPPDQNSELISTITVQHLLEHTCGGWSNDFKDPMFTQPDFDHSQLIRWVLENRRLDYVPGTVWSYSNFGYCLLGRIIERVTSQTYAEYVRSQVLEPCGIHNMHIAGNTLADKRSNEVTYYPQAFYMYFGGRGPKTVRIKVDDDAYCFPIARMDSHGGWLATAVDLVRFALHVDGFATLPDILNASSIATMTTPTTAKNSKGDNPCYTKGWYFYRAGKDHHIQFNWFHDGNLPGTSSVIFRGSNGFCWAALANTWRGNSSMAHDLQEVVMWGIVEAVSEWPTHDLFAVYDDPWKAISVVGA